MTEPNFPKLLADCERRYAGLKHDAQAVLDVMREKAVVEFHADLETGTKLSSLLRRLQKTIFDHEDIE